MKKPLINLKDNTLKEVDLDDKIFGIKYYPDII